MSKYAESIDVRSSAVLEALVQQIQETRLPIPLTQDEEVVAVVQPAPRRKRASPETPSEADLAAARSAAGSWKGLIDAAKFKRAVYAARGSRRPPVRL
jgi:hypothetical protein